MHPERLVFSRSLTARSRQLRRSFLLLAAAELIALGYLGAAIGAWLWR